MQESDVKIKPPMLVGSQGPKGRSFTRQEHLLLQVLKSCVVGIREVGIRARKSYIRSSDAGYLCLLAGQVIGMVSYWLTAGDISVLVSIAML